MKVVSGDAENYQIAVYRAQVIASFKGPATGETIYFGPYVGERLGWDYVVFLRNLSKPVSPKKTSSAGYGTIQYGEVFDEGYGSMMISYECVFGGRGIAQQCDYGVRVCTNYVRLPKSIHTFPPAKEDTAFGCRWVRKTVFVSLLETLGRKKQRVVK